MINTLESAIEAVSRRILREEVSFFKPGKILSIDTRTSSVLAKVEVPLKKKELGSNLDFPKVQLSDVPVIFPRTNNFIFRPPIDDLVGSWVGLLVPDTYIQDWLDQGNDVIPTSNTQFNIQDAVAILGVYPNSDAWGDKQVKKSVEILTKNKVGFIAGTDATKIEIDGDSDKISIGQQSAEMAGLLLDVVDILSQAVCTTGGVTSALTASGSGNNLIQIKTALLQIANQHPTL